MWRSRLCLLGLVSAMALGACGGSSDEDSTATSASDYLEAVADGDGEAACQQLSAEGQTFASQYAASRRLGTLDCAQAISQLSPALPHAQLETYSSVSAEIDADDVQLSGSTATVTVPRVNVPIYLEKEGEDWKVSATSIEGTFATGVF